jgi:hypothetical protein
MSKRPKTHAEAVGDSRKATGSKPIAITLTPAEQERWEKIAKRFPTKKAAFLAMLDALEGKNEISRAELLSEIERRLK